MHILVHALIGIVLICWSRAAVAGGCSSDRHAARAGEYFEHAIELLEDGHWQDSVPFFRAAVKLCPQDWNMWFRLGTAEQLTGEVGKAKSRFLRALSCPGAEHDQIQTALNELIESSPSSTCSTAESDRQAYPALPLLELSQIGPSSLVRPFGIPRITEDLADRAEDILAYFKETFGHYPVEFYPQNMRPQPKRLYHNSLAEALDYLAFPDAAYISSDTSESGAYIQWPLDLQLYNSLASTFQLDKIPDFLPSSAASLFRNTPDQPVSLSEDLEALYNKTHWFMLLIGEKGAGMFNHTDQLPVGSWQAQLWGRKRWVICQPQQVAFPDHSSNPDVLLLHSSGEDACYETELTAGQGLYYPPYYYHETECLEGPCISISSTVLAPHYQKQMQKFIQEECASQLRGYQFARSLCNRLDA